MRIAVLGPTRVSHADGAVVPLERKARELVAILALRSPSTSSIDELAELLWDDPPPSAAKTVQSHLSRIRTALRTAGFDPTVLVREGADRYALRPPAGSLDVDEVVALRREARHASDTAAAAALLAAAEVLWAGDPELPSTVSAAGLAARCAADRDLLAHESLGALVDGPAPDVAVPRLQALVRSAPLDERWWTLLVRAQQRSGRPAEALRTFQRAREALAEVGLEPGPGLRQAEAMALEPTAPPAGPEVRYAPSARGAVAYVELGTGPALLVLNPGVLSIDALLDEPHASRALARLAEDARVLVPDRRGVGLSDAIDPAAAPALDQWADDAVAVLDAASARSAVVLAASDTGMVALALAARHPSRVRGLVLVHAYPRYTRAPDYPYGVDPATAQATSADALATTGAADGRFDPLAHLAPSVAGDRAFRAWWERAGRSAASPGAASVLHQAVQAADVRGLLPEITAPTVLLHRRSCASSDPGHARHLVEHLPSAEVEWLPGADEIWFTGDDGQLVEAVVAATARLADQG